MDTFIKYKILCLHLTAVKLAIKILMVTLNFRIYLVADEKQTVHMLHWYTDHIFKMWSLITSVEENGKECVRLAKILT